MTHLIGVSEKKKINKREKEKSLTFKGKIVIITNRTRKCVFCLGKLKTPMQDKKKKSYSGTSQKNYVASETKGM